MRKRQCPFPTTPIITIAEDKSLRSEGIFAGRCKVLIGSANQ